MNILVLDRADSWHALDLKRAAGSDHKIDTSNYKDLSVQFADCQDRVSDPSSRLQSDFFAGKKVNGHYQAILTRAMPSSSLEQIVFRMDWLDQLTHQQKILVANPAKTIESCVDKYLSLEKLRAFDLPVPEIHVSQSCQDALRYFTDSGGDSVIKPLFGSRGRGIVRITNHNNATRYFAELETNGNLIYQQRFVEHGDIDLRLLVIGEEVIGMQRRRPDHWVTNANLGAECTTHQPTIRETELAIAAAHSQGAFIAGVDIVYEGSNPLIVEVNACPAWKMTSTTTKIDISKRVLDLLVALC